jgi:GT2 family glycosyltransferase
MDAGPPLSISVIIPTKSRADDLDLTINSLLRQTCLPDEVIVVDQSAEKSLTRSLPLRVRYLHDPSLSGAAAARNAAMNIATGDIWLFLDDDVELEPNFLKELLASYTPEIAGVSGIITNYAPPAPVQRIWDATFVRGIFHDARQRLYWHAEQLRDSPPIRVDRFTGALMSFRASVLRGIRWDSGLRGGSFHPQDDLDFCYSLPEGSLLVIAPRARLVHHRTPVARSATHWLFTHAQSNYFMWQRHWRKRRGNWASFTWLRVGYTAMAVISTVKRRSLDPWRAWRNGARKGVELAARGPKV